MAKDKVMTYDTLKTIAAAPVDGTPLDHFSNGSFSAWTAARAAKEQAEQSLAEHRAAPQGSKMRRASGDAGDRLEDCQVALVNAQTSLDHARRTAQATIVGPVLRAEFTKQAEAAAVLLDTAIAAAKQLLDVWSTSEQYFMADGPTGSRRHVLAGYAGIAEPLTASLEYWSGVLAQVVQDQAR